MFSASKLLVIILCLIFLLSLRFFAYFTYAPVYQDGQEVRLQVILQETPQLSNRGQEFTIRNGANQRIRIQTNLNKLYHYGDSLAIQGSLQVTKMDNGYEFLSMYYPQISSSAELKNPFFEASGWVRERSSTVISSVLPSISSSLLLGIIFGSNEHFPEDFKEDLRVTGVLHVIAASGMNVAFFVGAVLFSLGRLFTRRLSLLLALSVVIMYSFLVGFQPSILRASIMALIAVTASFFGRQSLALFSLFVTGIAMLFWSPAFLFDVGFQLSFMATLGILLINPRLKWFDRLGSFGEDVKTTVSAQLATFPILLGTFGSVGILGILVNVLILWTVPILMVFGVIGVILGLVFVPLGQLVIFVTIPFLWYFETVVSFFGSFGWQVGVETFPWQLSVGYYFLLGAGLLYLVRKR